MKKTQRIAEFWKWLPTFRIVAETQHVRLAAERLFVSPSAVSRTIQLLEESLGTKLFRRVGRNLQLTEAGADFLRHVRRAMRLIDDGLARLGEREPHGEVRIAATGAFTCVAIHTLERMMDKYPNLTGSVETRNENLAGPLHRGEVDLVFAVSNTEESDLESHFVGDLRNGLFVGRAHQLAETSDSDSWRDFDFVVPTSPPIQGYFQDGWPAHLTRQIALRVSDVTRAQECVASNRYVAALPVHIAGSNPALVEIPGPELRPTPIFALRREMLTEGDLIAQLIEAAGQTLAGE